MYGLEVIHRSSRKIIKLDNNISLDEFIEKIIENAGDFHDCHDFIYFIDATEDEDNPGYYRRLSDSNLLWGHGATLDGVKKITQDYIDDCQSHMGYPANIEILKDNIDKFMADYSLYDSIPGEELHSLIFDTPSAVCEYYTRQDSTIRYIYSQYYINNLKESKI